MNIRDFFSFEPVGARLDELETPGLIVDIADRNLKTWQACCGARRSRSTPDIAILSKGAAS